jgi:bis(5'-nucleosyl)-tetraphosphatase (symmetrical)
MKHFVVGDIQGCYKGLSKLLKIAGFKANKDKLWAVGDLVARGPDSLTTLEFLYDLGPHFDTVLGNHDLHLIASAYGISKPKPQDKLETLLKHKKIDTYVDWLRSKPLAASPVKNVFISHAGLYPSWSINKALKLSKEVEAQLQGKHLQTLLQNMYGNLPNMWSKDLSEYARYRFIVNAFTRMRYLYQDNTLDFDTKCHPKNANKNLFAWFNQANTTLKPSQTLFFGHWASLLGEVPENLPIAAKVVALDTGFVWGNKMRIYCIETQEIFHYQA